MATAALLWVHALAALLLFGAALVVWRSPVPGAPSRLPVVALALTGLWALAVAGIGYRDPATLLMQGLRNLAWLALVARLGTHAARSRSRDASFLAVAVCLALGMTLAVIAGALPVMPVERAALALRMLALTGGLLLVYRIGFAAPAGAGGGRALLLAAIAIVWSADLLISLAAYVTSGWPAALLVARGAALGVAALLVAMATRHEAALSPSRGIALRALLAAGVFGYLVATALVLGWLGRLGGDHTRAAQTAFVVGTAVALLTLVATRWLRAWAKVMVAKHLFRHRYDYRVEWLRFTATLGTPDDGTPLAARIAKAMADLTCSPAALLLARDADGLAVAADWRWMGTAQPLDAALAHHLAATRRILDLDAIRAGAAPAEEATLLPEWLAAHADAWAVAPLIHGDRLVGTVVLARPPVARALDWEDFDLLGAAGRQAASHLAEERAHAALAEARRFEEFNRRFAFIGHDLKNLVSQLALLARNAERHADNPAFRADMVATLAESSRRMSALLARLSQHAAPAAEPPRAVALLALLERIADARRAQHPVRAAGDAAAMALADPAALETAIGHLLQNAIEASPAGVPVLLCAHADDDDGVTVEVSDRGAGMAPTFVRDDLFRPFASAKPGGFGLGAHEARAMVRQMGGEVSVDSRIGEGTTFRLHLPAARALEAAA